MKAIWHGRGETSEIAHTQYLPRVFAHLWDSDHDTERERVSAPVEATPLSPWTGGIRLIPEGLNLDCLLKGSLVIQTSLGILRTLLISHDTAQRLSETPQASQ